MRVENQKRIRESQTSKYRANINELKRRYSENEFNQKPNIGEAKRKSEKIKK